MRFGKNMYVNNDRILEEKSDVISKYVFEEEAENDEEVSGFFLFLVLNVFLFFKVLYFLCVD